MNADLGSQRRSRNAEFTASKCRCACSPYLTSFRANASIVFGPWNFSVPELPKWIQQEWMLFWFAFSGAWSFPRLKVIAEKSRAKLSRFAQDFRKGYREYLFPCSTYKLTLSLRLPSCRLFRVTFAAECKSFAS